MIQIEDKSRTRPIPYSLKLSEAEAEALSAIAAKVDLPKQEVVRELIKNKALVLGVWPKPTLV